MSTAAIASRAVTAANSHISSTPTDNLTSSNNNNNNKKNIRPNAKHGNDDMHQDYEGDYVEQYREYDDDYEYMYEELNTNNDRSCNDNDASDEFPEEKPKLIGKRVSSRIAKPTQVENIGEEYDHSRNGNRNSKYINDDDDILNTTNVKNKNRIFSENHSDLTHTKKSKNSSNKTNNSAQKVKGKRLAQPFQRHILRQRDGLSVSPFDSSDDFHPIRQLVLTAQYQIGLAEVEAHLLKHPNHIEAINLKVHCLRSLHGISDVSTNTKCIEILRKALQEDDVHILSLFNIGSCYYELGEYVQAIKYYEQIVPSDEKVLFNLALCYEHVGDLQSAQIHYEKWHGREILQLFFEVVTDLARGVFAWLCYATGETLKLNSRYSSGVVNYSNLLMRMGDIDASRALLEAHLKSIHSRDDKALNNLNIALAEKRLDKKADFLFRKALNNSAVNSLASSSQNPTTINSQPAQQTHEKLPDQQLQQRESEHQLSFEPSLLYNHGILYFKQGKLNLALDAFQKFTKLENVLESDPLILLSYVNQALILEKMHKFDQAIAIYSNMIERFRETVNASELEAKITEIREKQLQHQQQRLLATSTTPTQLQNPEGQLFSRPISSWITSKRTNPFLHIRHRFYANQAQLQQQQSPTSHLLNSSEFFPISTNSQAIISQEMTSSDGMRPRNKQQLQQQQQQQSIKFDNFISASLMQGNSNNNSLNGGNLSSLIAQQQHQQQQQRNQQNRAVNYENLEKLSKPKKKLKEDPNVKSPTELSPNRYNSTWNSAVFERLSKHQQPSTKKLAADSKDKQNQPQSIVFKVAKSKLNSNNLNLNIQSMKESTNNNTNDLMRAISPNRGLGIPNGSVRIWPKRLYQARQTSPLFDWNSGEKSYSRHSNYSMNGGAAIGTQQQQLSNTNERMNTDDSTNQRGAGVKGTRGEKKYGLEMIEKRRLSQSQQSRKLGEENLEKQQRLNPQTRVLQHSTTNIAQSNSAVAIKSKSSEKSLINNPAVAQEEQQLPVTQSEEINEEIPLQVEVKQDKQLLKEKEQDLQLIKQQQEQQKEKEQKPTQSSQPPISEIDKKQQELNRPASKKNINVEPIISPETTEKSKPVDLPQVESKQDQEVQNNQAELVDKSKPNEQSQQQEIDKSGVILNNPNDIPTNPVESSHPAVTVSQNVNSDQLAIPLVIAAEKVEIPAAQVINQNESSKQEQKQHNIQQTGQISQELPKESVVPAISPKQQLQINAVKQTSSINQQESIVDQNKVVEANKAPLDASVPIAPVNFAATAVVVGVVPVTAIIVPAVIPSSALGGTIIDQAISQAAAEIFTIPSVLPVTDLAVPNLVENAVKDTQISAPTGVRSPTPTVSKPASAAEQIIPEPVAAAIIPIISEVSEQKIIETNSVEKVQEIQEESQQATHQQQQQQQQQQYQQEQQQEQQQALEQVQEQQQVQQQADLIEQQNENTPQQKAEGQINESEQKQKSEQDPKEKVENEQTQEIDNENQIVSQQEQSLPPLNQQISDEVKSPNEQDASQEQHQQSLEEEQKQQEQIQEQEETHKVDSNELTEKLEQPQQQELNEGENQIIPQIENNDNQILVADEKLVEQNAENAEEIHHQDIEVVEPIPIDQSQAQQAEIVNEEVDQIEKEVPQQQEQQQEQQVEAEVEEEEEQKNPNDKNEEEIAPSAAVVIDSEEAKQIEEESLKFIDGTGLPADFFSWTREFCEDLITQASEQSYLAHYRLGLLELELNELQLAKEQFVIVAEMQPTFQPARIQLAIAEIFVQQGDWQSAIEHYRACFDNCAEFSDEPLNHNNTQSAAGATTLATGEFRFDVLMKIGRCYKKLGDISQAESTYISATKTNNNPTKSVRPYYKLAKMQLQSGKIEAAIALLSQALAIQPKEILTHLRLGGIYLEMDVKEYSQSHNSESQSQHKYHQHHHHRSSHHENGQSNQNSHRVTTEETKVNNLDSALQYFVNALEIDNNSYQALICLGKLYDKRNDLDKSIGFMESAVLHADHNLNAVYYLGTLYFKKKLFDQSAECFKQVLIEDPEHIPSVIEYAIILSMKGEYDKAKKYFKVALRMNPNNLMCNMRLGKIYQSKLNNLKSAMECYQKSIQIDPNCAKAHFQIGVIHSANKEFKEAIASFQACLKLNPKNGQAWREIASVFSETGNPAKALKYYLKAQSYNSTVDPVVETGIANCYYFLEDYEVAIQKYEVLLHKQHAVEANANGTEGDNIRNIQSQLGLMQEEDMLHNLGDCYFMREDMENAIKNYELAIARNGEKPDCLYNLGNAFCMTGRYADAQSAFEKCIELDPQNASAYYNLGNVHYIEHDETKAWMYFEQAIEKEPENIEWRNYIAQTYYDAGKFEEALSHLRASYATSNLHFETCLRLTQTYIAMNSHEDAKQFLKICLELEPDNQDIRQIQEEGGELIRIGGQSSSNQNRRDSRRISQIIRRSSKSSANNDKSTSSLHQFKEHPNSTKNQAIDSQQQQQIAL